MKRVLRYIILGAFILLLVLMGCQFARDLVGPGESDNPVREKLANAQAVIKQIEKAVRGDSQAELKDALTAIKDIIKLYEANKVSSKDISIMKWLLVALCILSVIQIAINIRYQRLKDRRES